MLDTNVLIDASDDYYRYANRIVDLVIAGQVNAYANKSTLKENKFLILHKITDPGFLKKIEYFFEAVRPVENSKRLNVVEDQEDNKILESAMASGADYLITSDRHLLMLVKYQGVRIVRPEAFWQAWEEGAEHGWLKWLENFIK